MGKIAQQMGLVDQVLYQQINCSELLNNNWTKKEKEKLSPNILRIVKHFNDIVNWAISIILTSKSKKQASSLLNKFGEIMQDSFKIDDHHNVRAISAVFDSVPIHRLISKKYLNVKEKNENFLKYLRSDIFSKNNSGYRRILSKCSIQGKSCVPYIGIFFLFYFK